MPRWCKISEGRMATGMVHLWNIGLRGEWMVLYWYWITGLVCCTCDCERWWFSTWTYFVEWNLITENQTYSYCRSEVSSKRYSFHYIFALNFLFTGYKTVIAKNCIDWYWLNPFQHTTNLQQTTLNIFCQKMENLYNWMDNQWL